MGAQVPGAAFASISKLSDALSVRGDKKYAMRCRKKPRDALSVRTLRKMRGCEMLESGMHQPKRLAYGDPLSSVRGCPPDSDMRLAQWLCDIREI